MTTTMTKKRQADGSYAVEPGGYTIRKQRQDEVYDAWADLRSNPAIIGRPPVPKAKGWMLEHSTLEHAQHYPTVDSAMEAAECHRFGFWHSRAEKFATEIDAIDESWPNDAIKRRVVYLVGLYGLTTGDFIELDERPGQFHINGRSYGASNWHRNLRITRNDPDVKLFDALKENTQR